MSSAVNIDVCDTLRCIEKMRLVKSTLGGCGEERICGVGGLRVGIGHECMGLISAVKAAILGILI
jgi:hypothetical protein